MSASFKLLPGVVAHPALPARMGRWGDDPTAPDAAYTGIDHLDGALANDVAGRPIATHQDIFRSAACDCAT